MSPTYRLLAMNIKMGHPNVFLVLKPMYQILPTYVDQDSLTCVKEGMTERVRLPPKK